MAFSKAHFSFITTISNVNYTELEMLNLTQTLAIKAKTAMSIQSGVQKNHIDMILSAGSVIMNSTMWTNWTASLIQATVYAHKNKLETNLVKAVKEVLKGIESPTLSNFTKITATANVTELPEEDQQDTSKKPSKSGAGPKRTIHVNHLLFLSTALMVKGLRA